MVLNHNKIKYDCIVNIDTGKITFNSETPEKILKTTKEEKVIYNNILNKIKSNFDDKNETWLVNMNLYEPVFEGSDDFIRNEFKSYFFDFLVNVSLAMQIANYTSNDSIHLAILSDCDENMIETDSDEEQQSNGSENEINNKKKKKEHDKNLAKSIKKVLSTYNVHLITAWIKTINFKYWVNQHDKSLCLRSSYVKQANNLTYVYENGDVYVGSLSRGKKCGHGILNELSTNSVYNGSWENDMV
jgi:hypothetical protein